MKKVSRLLVFLLVITSSLNAQKVYFIYLQTDNQQPFYVRMGEKVYNSTPAGYIILSNLRDSSYSIKIGVRGTQATDQAYSIVINKKDRGFIIKDFGEKGLGLFDLHSMAVIMPLSTTSVKPVQTVKTEKVEDNAFINLLAKAADDPTIKERPVIEKPSEKTAEVTVLTTDKTEETKNDVKEIDPSAQEEVKKETVPVEKKEDPKIDLTPNSNQVPDAKNAAMIAGSAAVVKDKDEAVKQDSLIKEDTVKTSGTETDSTVEYKRSVVILKSESSTTTGIGLVFIDLLANDNTDTIRIHIPAETNKAISIGPKPEEKKFLDIPPVDSVQKDEVISVATKNKNCKAEATENDFLRLRKKMIGENNDFFRLRKKMPGENNDDDMIAEARKVFKTKCFSTLQIKDLGTLFLTDESRYKFFDAAYQYVSDPGNFSSLQTELKEEYFINRFKAMLRQ